MTMRTLIVNFDQCVSSCQGLYQQCLGSCQS